MSRVVGRMVLAVCTLVCLAASAPAQQTTTATETKAFEVIAVDGNTLVVKLPEGTREITVPDDFRFTVDGRPMSVHDMKPGMKGTATITTKTTVTPVTVTEVKNGEVVQVSGNSIIVRTDQGMKRFTQSDVDKRGVKIVRNGEPASVSDFKAGDMLTATIVTTKPPQVVSQKEVQASLARSAPPAPAAPAATAGTAPPKPAPTTGSAAAQATPPATPKMPKTASPLPLLGLAALGSLVTAALLAARRRRLSR